MKFEKTISVVLWIIISISGFIYYISYGETIYAFQEFLIIFSVCSIALVYIHQTVIEYLLKIQNKYLKTLLDELLSIAFKALYIAGVLFLILL